MQVDASNQARLVVSHAASSDLSFLDQLQTDDLHTLELSRSRVDDQQLARVGRLTGLRVLDLNQTRITDAGIAHLAGLKMLRRIGLEAFSIEREGFGVGDAAMGVLATLPELQSIDLRLTKVTDAGLLHLASLKSLKSLSIAGTKTTDAGMVALRKLPKLEYLRLGVYDEGIELTDEGLRDVGQIETLKSLDLSGTKVTDEGLRHLHNLKHLEDLSLEGTKVSQEGLALLEPIQSLRTLRLYLDWDVNDDGAILLSRLKSLRRLTAFLRVTEKGVQALAALPHLEHVDLSEHGITDAAIMHVARIPSLKSLSLQDCPVTDDGLAKLAALDHLELLQLYDTQVTTRGFQHLRRLTRLRNLSYSLDDQEDAHGASRPTLEHIGQLSKLKNLTIRVELLANADLAHLAGLQDLQELFLEAMPVNDMGAFHLAGLTSLTHLSLENAIVTDEGLTHLANLRNLEFLNLSGHFTDKGLQRLAKFKSLKNAYLASPYLTDEGIAAFAAALPSLSSVHRQSFNNELPEISYREYDTFRREGLEAERTDKNALELKAPPPLSLAGWVNANEDGLTLDELAGRVVIVDFWGTWCGPCRAAMPKLKKLHEQYPDDLVILGIHTTSGAEEMPAYVAAEKIPWPIACDVEEQTVHSWHVDSYPDLYLIDRQGRLRVADLYQADVDRAVRMLVAEDAKSLNLKADE